MGFWRDWSGRVRASLADRRRHARISDPGIVLAIAGRSYRSIDWSLGGVKLADLAGVGRGDVVRGTLSAPDGASGAFEAEVLRVEPDGAVALRFLALAGPLVVALGESGGVS